MAEDSGKASAANQEIDLDNIEVEILIICKNAAQLNQAGSFLTRRGWPTTVITDLTKAIEHLADKKPDFVLVSFSHPSPRISKLPDLITQTFNLTCLGFVETSDAQSNAKLSNSKVRYKINGQASGPSVHRTIRKILAERFNIKTEEKSSSSERSHKDDGSSIVKVKGSSTAANGPGVIMQKSSANATRDKGAQMMKGDGQSKMHEAQSGSISVSGNAGGGGMAYGGGSEGAANESDLPELNESDSEVVPMGDGGYAAVKSKDKRKSLKDLAGDSSNDNAGNMMLGKNLEDKKAKLKSLLEEGADEEAADEGSEGSNAKRGGGPTSLSMEEAAAAAAAAQAAADSENGASKKKTPKFEIGERNGENKAPLMQYDPLNPQKTPTGMSLEAAAAEKARIEQEAKAKTEIAAKEKAAAEEKAKKEKEEAELIAKDPARAAQSLMQKAVEAAMNRYCKTPPDAQPLPLEEITYVGVFPVDSESLPGYLVVVWQAPDLSSREAFLRDCETEIRAAFGSMNVNGKLGTGFWTQLPAVEFVAWADNKANFHFMTAHQKREVGVAFFKAAAPLPKAQAAEGGMYSIKVSDLSTDVPVNFKTYLYLKNNKKHFMYLRNGRKLQPEQKKRLLENQVSQLLLKSVDLENVRQYLAAGYLSGLIIEFNGTIALATQLTRKSS